MHSEYEASLEFLYFAIDTLIASKNINLVLTGNISRKINLVNQEPIKNWIVLNEKIGIASLNLYRHDLIVNIRWCSHHVDQIFSSESHILIFDCFHPFRVITWLNFDNFIRAPTRPLISKAGVDNIHFECIKSIFSDEVILFHEHSIRYKIFPSEIYIIHLFYVEINSLIIHIHLKKLLI